MSNSTQTPASAGRSKLLVRFLFTLFLLHFVVAYAAPHWLMIDEFQAWLMQETIGHGSLPWTGGPSGPGMFGMPGGGGPPPGVIQDGENRLLWAGADKSQHFDITSFRLEPSQLRYGLGREVFPALLDPEFESAEVANKWLSDDDKIIAVKIDQEVKVYPVRVLRRHEVVNDVVGDRPIFACYCILADLGAIYDRQMDDHTYTFAVSGYTYGDPHVWDVHQAFVLWDRDTESLWWPPIGKAVSGPLIDRTMKLLEEPLWAQMTWHELKREHPDTVVLQQGQQMQPPKDWPRHDVSADSAPVNTELEELGSNSLPPTTDAERGVPPRWGQNPKL